MLIPFWPYFNTKCNSDCKLLSEFALQYENKMDAKRLFLLLILGLILSKWSSAQQQGAYPLSRQDSALINKYTEHYHLQDSLGDKKEASRFLNRIAMIYWEHNHYQKAIENYNTSMRLNEELGNENGIAMINNNMAMIYADMGNYNDAIQYFENTLIARRVKNEKIGVISALINLSVVKNNIENYRSSIGHLQEALAIARQMNDPQQMRSCYGMLSETYEKAGRPDSSLYYFDLYRTFHEMIQQEEITENRRKLENERLQRRLAEMEKRNKELELETKQAELDETEQTLEEYTTDRERLIRSLSKKELEVRVLEQESEIDSLKAQREKNQLIAEREQEHQMLLMVISASIFLSILILILILANRQKKQINTKLEKQNNEIRRQQSYITKQNNELQAANSEIDKQNKQIISSINYAKLIQTSMLRRKVELTDILPNSFVIFWPRDIVSGDFYWYDHLDHRTYIAAVDCTGHGVPGAFMSMVGNNLLRLIVNTQREYHLPTILKKMNIGVNSALNQTLTENQDGMDMALCVIDHQKKQLHFAGAKNPLLLFQDGEMHYIKGSKFPVGGYNNIGRRVEYQEHIIPINGGETFYIFSDGYIDQFNDKGEKYKIKRFRKLLAETHKEQFSEQKEILETELTNWMNDHSQIDDILVIGCKIDLIKIPNHENH